MLIRLAEHIANLVQDDAWRWKNVQARYKALENYHSSTIYQHRLNPRNDDHGYAGPLHIGFPCATEEQLYDLFDAAVDCGWPLCEDQNSGNPIGIGVAAATTRKGHRIMSSDLLNMQASNLTVITERSVARILFEEKQAKGVLLIDEQQIFAQKEVVLCAGPLADPKILLHSGIGPAETLKHFGIPIVQSNDHVGQHLRDHQLAVFSLGRKESTSDRLAYYRDPARQAAARVQFEKDGTGPLAEYATTFALAFLKIDRLYASKEFADLDEDTQAFLKLETIPHWETSLNGPSIEQLVDPANAPSMTSAFCFLMNSQSEGSVCIQSANPEHAVLVDTNYFSHPFDKRLAIELTRDLQAFVTSPGFGKNTTGTINMPFSGKEEDIIEFWKKNSGSGSHPMGTCRMGTDAAQAVVDKEFSVYGTTGLRVCSTSVLPLLPNCHLMSTSYLVGLLLSEKLFLQYELNQSP